MSPVVISFSFSRKLFLLLDSYDLLKTGLGNLKKFTHLTAYEKNPRHEDGIPLQEMLTSICERRPSHSFFSASISAFSAAMATVAGEFY